MRKILILALAASTLAPIAAQAQDRGPQGGQAQGVRQEQRDGGHDRGEAHADNRAEGRGDDHRDFREERRDDRRDWRSYREAHRDAFRGSPYVGPRGFAYRPVAPGYRFDRDYYAQRYWINNPGAYRLPQAPVGQRWVRYGHDVVRVDLRSGRVIQVFGQFFL